MATRPAGLAMLSENRIFDLLQPYLPEDKVLDDALVPQLRSLLELLLRWNERTNLTAIRDPEEIVRRHFGESVFAAWHLEARIRAAATVLDFGSGAGFPGLPLQLYAPGLRVTLAESQGKKASFLREARRELGIEGEVWAQRVEAMPPDRRFDAVTMRAVDRMEQALPAALRRVSGGGLLVLLTTADEESPIALTSLPREVVPVPGGLHRELHVMEVPEAAPGEPMTS